MSTKDVPGANAVNHDVLAMGCWGEHDDGSLILVESVEAGTVVYSIFDLAMDPPLEYRDAMPEKGFKARFSWPNDDNLQWTWHDKKPFPWAKIMADFPSGSRHSSGVATLTAAQRLVQSLDLRGERIRKRHEAQPTEQRAARSIMTRLSEAVNKLRS